MRTNLALFPTFCGANSRTAAWVGTTGRCSDCCIRLLRLADLGPNGSIQPGPRVGRLQELRPGLVGSPLGMRSDLVQLPVQPVQTSTGRPFRARHKAASAQELSLRLAVSREAVT